MMMTIDDDDDDDDVDDDDDDDDEDDIPLYTVMYSKYPRAWSDVSCSHHPFAMTWNAEAPK